MSWPWLVGAGVVGLAVLVVVIGAALPVEHVATRSVTLNAAPERVRALVADVASAPSWRTGITRVEVTDAARFIEHSRFGPMAMVVDEDGPARRVTRIADDSQGFGGSWTFDYAPAAGGGTTVSITERGTVRNPLFRFLSRFVFGHTKTIEQYLADLARAVERR